MEVACCCSPAVHRMILALTDETFADPSVPIGINFWRLYLDAAGLTCLVDLAFVLSDKTERAMRCRVRPDHSARRRVATRAASVVGACARQPFTDLCRIDHCGRSTFGGAVESSDTHVIFRRPQMWVAGQVPAGGKETLGDGATDAVGNHPQARASSAFWRTRKLGAGILQSSAVGASGDQWLWTRKWAG